MTILCTVTQGAGLSGPSGEALRARLRGVLDVSGVTQSSLARSLTAKAEEHGLSKGYDPGMISRWLDGRLAISRPAVWLLDMLHPATGDEPAFQDLRDRFVVDADREQVPAGSAVSDLTMLQGARCTAHLMAASLPRVGLALAEDEQLVWLMLSVVDCGESRQIVDEVVRTDGSARTLAMYDLLGRWDLAVKLAMPAESAPGPLENRIHEQLVVNGMIDSTDAPQQDLREFRRHRTLVTDGTQIRSRTGSGSPEFLVLGSDAAYDLHRIQRTFLFVELNTLPDLRRSIARDRLIGFVIGNGAPCLNIVEAVTAAPDCLVLELLMTCADEPGRLNQLNRLFAPELTRFKAQKYNLLVYSADERSEPPG